MGYQPYAGAPQVMEPPEAQSIKSMLHIVRILAIIFGVLLFLAGLAYTALVWAAYNTCTSVAGNICAGSLGAVLIFPIVIVIFGLVDIVIYMQMRSIEGKVNARQYEAAKSQTLIWMILGFILGGLIIGILLLIAYLKFDPLIAWQRNQMAGAPAAGYAAPGASAAPGAYGAPPMAPPPAAAPAPGQKFCSSCGTPNAAGAQFCAKCGAAMRP
jgi:hypothetical protein